MTTWMDGFTMSSSTTFLPFLFLSSSSAAAFLAKTSHILVLRGNPMKRLITPSAPLSPLSAFCATSCSCSLFTFPSKRYLGSTVRMALARLSNFQRSLSWQITR